MDSSWLNDYHSRITEEYKFSMERKDRVTDWAIGIFFVTLVAYAELLRQDVPSIWRIALIVGLLSFIMRLFANSCLAYAYLKKWRYLLDSINKHWIKGQPSQNELNADIEKLHFSRGTTEKASYFIKSQLKAGFILLFIFPIFILVFEFGSNFDLYSLLPIGFLILYFFYESRLLWKLNETMQPSNSDVEAARSNDKPEESNGKGVDRAFDTFIIIQTLIFATIFQYLTWVGTPDDFLNVTKITRVFFIPILVILILWMISHLTGSSIRRLFIKTVAWYWAYLSFFIQFLFIGIVLFGDVLTSEIFLAVVVTGEVLTLIFGVFMQRKFQKIYTNEYSLKIMISTAIVSIVTALLFLLLVKAIT